MFRGPVLAAVVAGLTTLSVPLQGATRAVDTKRSTLTVHVGKSGVLSTFGDNHIVRAPIASGEVEDGEPQRVDITVDARQMTVLDPEVAPEKRAEVQKRMLGPEVLDVAKFPEIRFRSKAVEPLGKGRWKVEGVLDLHGRSAPVSFEVTGGEGECRGSATLSQRAFGIEPISVAGGTVKVKDEVKVDFEIVTAAREKSGKSPVSGSGTSGAGAR